MTSPDVRPIEPREHETSVDGRPLHVVEKAAPGGAENGTILFIHGSSMSSTPTFDVTVEGMPEASAMNWFANHGFDTWSFDCRGYGRSYKGEEVLATIAEGAEDAAAVSELILARNGGNPLMVYGISSGALRAAVFAGRFPERVARLALDAMVWTGKGSPTLEARRKKIKDWEGATRRPIDHPFLMSIFDRDHPGTVHEAIREPFIREVLEHDDSVPNGTYIDMCTRLPLCDPAKLTMPTLVMRGEYDGIAGFEDLLAFFHRLPNADKEFTVMPGVAHASFTQKNFLLVYQILHAFLTRPEPLYRGT